MAGRSSPIKDHSFPYWDSIPLPDQVERVCRLVTGELNTADADEVLEMILPEGVRGGQA